MSFELPMKNARAQLPVHGFVLAGGKSSRMGVDKALLPFRGRPMAEIAVEKLRGFCSAVSIAGNRQDLNEFAPVGPEARENCGPAAGIEAGLLACMQPWAMFVPVDVPLVPGELLRRWAETWATPTVEAGLAMGPLLGCSLYTKASPQPAFCLLRRESLSVFRSALDRGERRLSSILEAIQPDSGMAAYVGVSAGDCMAELSDVDMECWFSNVNTPQELAEAEAWAEARQASPLRG